MTQTLDTFKKNAQRAESYLQEHGIAVTHAVLLEALARYEGHRNYRTLKAEYAKSAPPKLQVPQVLAPNDSVLVVVETFGGGGFDTPSGRPYYVAFNVTQKALEELHRAHQVSQENSADLDGEFIGRHYLANEWRFGYDEVTVSRGSFYAKGCEDHSDAEFESNSVSLKSLIPALEVAKRRGAKLIFWDMDEAKATQAIEEVLDADDSGETTEPLMTLLKDEDLAKRICWQDAYLSER